MLTWLDYFCRRMLPVVDAKFHGGDPRKAFGFHLYQRLYEVQQGTASFEDILDEAFHVMLTPFLRDFFPAGGTATSAMDIEIDRPLGLVLTRGTANLLSDAESSNIPDEAWRSELGTGRAVYVDVPHGTILLDVGTERSDVLQLRAIFAAPFLPPNMPGHTLFIAHMTDRGSERGRGRVAGLLWPDGRISRFASEATGRSAADWTLRSPFVHSETERAVLGRTGTFLRLVLAYHFFGPPKARDPIGATPTQRLRAGKPRKDESLFALTRLHSSGEVGRPRERIPPSWSLTSRQEVSGHFKLQPHGPQLSMRRLIWVDGYARGPADAPIRPRAHAI